MPAQPFEVTRAGLWRAWLDGKAEHGQTPGSLDESAIECVFWISRHYSKFDERYIKHFRVGDSPSKSVIRVKIYETLCSPCTTKSSFSSLFFPQSLSFACDFAVVSHTRPAISQLRQNFGISLYIELAEYFEGIAITILRASLTGQKSEQIAPSIAYKGAVRKIST